MKKLVISLVVIVALIGVLVGCNTQDNEKSSLENQKNTITNILDNITNNLAACSKVSKVSNINTDDLDNMIDKYNDWYEIDNIAAYNRSGFIKMAIPIRNLVKTQGINSLLYAYNTDYNYIGGSITDILPFRIEIIGADISDNISAIYSVCYYGQESNPYISYFNVEYVSETDYKITIVTTYNESVEELIYYDGMTQDSVLFARTRTNTGDSYGLSYNNRAVYDLYLDGDAELIKSMMQDTYNDLLTVCNNLENQNISKQPRPIYNDKITLDFDVELYNSIVKN